MAVRILVGDAIPMLRTLPADHFDCVPVSPPYWGQRDYGTGEWIGGAQGCDHMSHEVRTGLGMEKLSERYRGGGKKASKPKPIQFRWKCGHCGAERIDHQIGLEATLGEHIDVMVAVFREVRRVLKPGGTVWLNYGDCYATAPNGRSAADTKELNGDDRTFRDKPFSTIGPVYDPTGGATGGGARGLNKGNVRPPGGRVVAGGYLKPGDLCMIPNRLAIALQDDGWWVKSEIIWGKNNPMPDSNGSTRPSTAHEKIFLLTKSNKVELWRARDTGELSTAPDLRERCLMRTTGTEGLRWLRMPHYYDAGAVALPASPNTHLRVSQDLASQIGSLRANGGTRPDRPMKAVTRKLAKPGSGTKSNSSFDEAMVEQPESRYLRNYEAPLTVWPMATEAFSDAHFATFPPELVERCLRAGCPKGGRVLDFFGGAGTTALVADRLGMDATLIELNPTYAAMAERRIRGDAGMFATVSVERLEVAAE